MKLSNYKLDEDNNVIQCSVEEWCDFIKNSENIYIANDIVSNEFISPKRVVTIFIGFDPLSDHNSVANVFVTNVFDSEKFDAGKRELLYSISTSSYDEAEKEHYETVNMAHRGLFG